MQKLRTILLLLIIILPFISAGQNFKDRTVQGEQKARHVVERALNDKDYKPFYDTLIKNRETAIAVAESILFEIYGKKIIIGERPYECYLIDGYWYICGTLRKNWMGGVFEILLNSKNATIIKLTHGK